MRVRANQRHPARKMRDRRSVDGDHRTNRAGSAFPAALRTCTSFSTATHGIRRRSAANASRARVNSFSFTRSCWRIASHSFADTTSRSIFSSVVFILLSCLFGLFSVAKYIESKGCHSPARCRCQESNICDAYRTHDSNLSFFAGDLVRLL